MHIQTNIFHITQQTQQKTVFRATWHSSGGHTAGNRAQVHCPR